MVSNVLDLTDEQLVQALKRLRAAHASEKDYRDWRKLFPQEWEM